MTPKEELAYMQGSQRAWMHMAQKCIKHLNPYSQEDVAIVITLKALKELSEVKQSLRDICEEYGDNDWEDDLHISDVIEKHLRRHLDNNREKSA